MRKTFLSVSGCAALLIGCSISPSSQSPIIDTDLLNASPALRESEDKFDVVFSGQIKDGAIEEMISFKLDPSAFQYVDFTRDKPSPEADHLDPNDKIHPRLKEMLRAQDEQTRARIIIGFSDDIEIPRFPEPALDESVDSETNSRARKRAQQIVDELRKQRHDQYIKFMTSSAELHGWIWPSIREVTAGRIVDTQNLARLRRQKSNSGGAEIELLQEFWLVNAIMVDMPLDAVSELALRKDVTYLEPDDTGAKPPQDANANNDVDDARRSIISDPYFNERLSSGWIGLLDTGVRDSHTLFVSPDHLAFLRDCTNGDPSCSGATANTDDDCWNHGTSTAAIITGNANLGNRFRGVTEIRLDSWKVYPSGCGGLSTSASVTAFQQAVSVLDRIIVAEMQGGGDFRSQISRAADNAFDAGAAVIAANGNNGPGVGTVNVPANAHKAIGVGNFNINDGAQITGQSRGPTADNRIKPDIQAPTLTETASTSSNTALRVFSGTSGATPYGAAGAALLRNWLRKYSRSIDPGQVYAQLILSGQQPYPFNNTSGAGPIKLPVNGWGWWGKVSIRSGQTIEIPLNIGSGSLNVFDAALWWPEGESVHNDVDLSIIDPSGVVRDASISVPSVFERAQHAGSLAAGTWKVRIRGFNVPSTSQTVYWTAAARRQ